MSGRKGSLPFVPLFLLVSIFYLNFVARIILAPLLPIIEGELHLGHGQAGSFFFYVAFGYGVGLLGSGFISFQITHRLTIALAGIMGGTALVFISRSTSLMGIHSGLMAIGIFAGFYLPSGIATLTENISRENWGKAMAIHELAPNVAFISTPLISEFLLRFFSWRGALAVLGCWAILMPLLFLPFGRGSRRRGEPLRLASLKEILFTPSCWMMGAFFTISIGASYGLYTILPLFLTSEIGMDRVWANTLMGLSRTFGVVVLFSSGFFIDRMGPKRAMALYLISTAIFTFLLGFTRGSSLVPVLVFLQSASVVCLFPVGFTILSMAFPDRLRGAAVALVIFIGFFIGGGIIPPAIGYWAEAFSFSSGFALLGVLFLSFLPLFWRYRARLRVAE